MPNLRPMSVSTFPLEYKDLMNEIKISSSSRIHKSFPAITFSNSEPLVDSDSESTLGSDVMISIPTVMNKSSGTSKETTPTNDDNTAPPIPKSRPPPIPIEFVPERFRAHTISCIPPPRPKTKAPKLDRSLYSSKKSSLSLHQSKVTIQDATHHGKRAIATAISSCNIEKTNIQWSPNEDSHQVRSPKKRIKLIRAWRRFLKIFKRNRALVRIYDEE